MRKRITKNNKFSCTIGKYIEIYMILSGKYDAAVIPRVYWKLSNVTEKKSKSKYDLRKFTSLELALCDSILLVLCL